MDTITTAAQAAELPVGTILTTRIGTFTAEKLPNQFRGNEPGWLVEGAAASMREEHLFTLARTWTVLIPA